jgi:predicted nucleic acid-binding protein
LWKNASAKLQVLDTLRQLLTWAELTDADWAQAARWWVETQSQGKQLADMDLLIAALTQRLDAVLVSADNDFDALAVPRVNWRIP